MLFPIQEAKTAFFFFFFSHLQSASETEGMGQNKDISHDLSLHFADEETDK